MEQEIKDIFEFFKIAEKLKTELRHSWTSNSERRESTAEHSWMLLLMSVVLIDKVSKEVDKLKTLKMLIIHDLVEAIAHDIPSHEISQRQDQKQVSEREALITITKSLESQKAEEIVELWEEFEARQTEEAKFAYAMDKFECLFQHDVADINTWDDGDYRYTFIEKQDTPFDYDVFMRQMKNTLDDWTFSKVTAANTVDQIPKENLERYHKSRSK